MILWQQAVKLSKQQGHNLLIFAGQKLNSDYRYTKEENIIYNLINDELVDGFILSTGAIMPIVLDGFEDFLGRFSSLPSVSISVQLDNMPSVIMDNKEGMKSAIEHLIKEHKYERIAFIKGPEKHDEAIARYSAYKEVLAENDIEFDALLVLPGDFFSHSGVNGVKRLAELDLLDIDAIACVNDDTALGVLSELKNRNISVPEEIAVVGFDNITGIESTIPPLATVEQPITEMMNSAYKSLCKLVNNHPVDNLKSISSKFISRESCGCLPYSKNKRKNNLPVSVNNEIDDFLSTLKDMLYNIEQNGLDHSKFLKFFKQKVSDTILDKGLNIDWFNNLQTLQKQLFNDISEKKYQLELIELFGNAQMIISEVISQHKGIIKNNQAAINILHRELKQDLNEVDNLEQLTDVVADYMNKIGLEEGYLVLYESYPVKTGLYNWEIPEVSKLKLSYSNGKKDSSIKDGISFLTKNLLPDTIIKREDHYQLAVTALYDREKHFGYIVQSANLKNSLYYVVLQEYLNTAISRIYTQDKRRILEEQVKSTLEELKVSNSKLTQLDDLKNDFIANITHDFRSPLTIILNNADIALKYENKGNFKQVHNRLNSIYNASGKLKKAIDRLLDISRMDSEGLKLNIQKVKPKQFLAQLSDFYRSSIVSSGIKILDSLPHKEIDNFYSDIDKLEEILSNIISNAVKFIDCNSGEIILSLIDKKSSIEIEIIDNGIGIKKEKLVEIFNRFEQVESGRDSLYHGTGLGLAFSKQLTHFLKGSIRAESDGLGAGAKFVLEFPKGKDHFNANDIAEDLDHQIELKFSESKKGEIWDVISEPKSEIVSYFSSFNRNNEYDHLKGIILIVEDNDDIRNIELSYLQNNGYCNFVTACDGLQGIDAAYKYRPDLIICDYNMPNLKGDQFHDQLISNPDFKKVPFIFVTALTDRNVLLDRQRKGAVAHLSKPIQEDELITLISIHMKKYMEYKEIVMQATIDELTKLNNRRHLMKLFKDKIAERKLYSFSIIFFDIDHFKAINDTYGHQAGDKVLKAIGECLNNSLRPYDIAGRYGGEEFIILLPDTNRFQASIVTDKLRHQFSEMEIEYSNEIISFSASFGIASLMDDSEYICRELKLNSLSELYDIIDKENADWLFIDQKKEELVDLLIKMADEALYHAKSTICEKCNYSSEKSELFVDGICPECGSNKLILGRNKLVCFVR